MTTVSEVMTRVVETIHPDDPLIHAAQLMDELDVGSLPVCDGDRLVGVVTDRDLTIRGMAAGLDANEAHVAEVMSGDPCWCTEDQDTAEVMQQMGDEQIRRMPVLNDAHQLVGIVSLGDLATRSDEDTDETLRDISEPSQPRH